MPLSEILYQFKQKNINQQDVSKLYATMKQHNLKDVPLWRISSLTRLISNTAKLQGYLVIIAGLLFIPAAIYDKYQQDPSKIYKIAVYTPIATAFVLAPLLMYKRNIKKVLSSIDYNLPSNSFKLQTYTNEVINVPINNLKVTYNPQKPKIVHEIFVSSSAQSKKSKDRVFKIQGYGQWQSAELFKYIVENGGIKQEIL